MSTSRETITYSPGTICILGAIGFSVIAYLYFLNVSVVHVVMRKEAMQEVQNLKNEIALLETEYIVAQHTIAARMATVDGYREDSEKVFVARTNTQNLVFGQ
jgi:hypothetical protein